MTCALKRALFIVLLSFPAVSFSEVPAGTVCLGKNLAVPLSEHSDRLFLRVGSSEEIYFKRPYNGPRIVATGLDITADHQVTVFFDGKPAQSWKLSFQEMKTASVLIWRAKGSWRMEPNEVSSCTHLGRLLGAHNQTLNSDCRGVPREDRKPSRGSRLANRWART